MVKFDDLVKVRLHQVPMYENVWLPRVKRPRGIGDLASGFKSGRREVAMDGSLLDEWEVESDAVVWIVQEADR